MSGGKPPEEERCTYIVTKPTWQGARNVGACNKTAINVIIKDVNTVAVEAEKGW